MAVKQIKKPTQNVTRSRTQLINIYDHLFSIIISIILFIIFTYNNKFLKYN